MFQRFYQIFIFEGWTKKDTRSSRSLDLTLPFLGVRGAFFWDQNRYNLRQRRRITIYSSNYGKLFPTKINRHATVIYPHLIHLIFVFIHKPTLEKIIYHFYLETSIVVLWQIKILSKAAFPEIRIQFLFSKYFSEGVERFSHD